MSRLIKPEAPHNSNQFLIEDQGRTEEIDERLRTDKVASRNRDSSFSVDSDGEFYSSPSDEEAFLIKDFDDQYESLHVERLNGMSKSELVQEFLMLEKKLDAATKRLKCKGAQWKICERICDDAFVLDKRGDLTSAEGTSTQSEIDRLSVENETLRRENNDLRNKLSLSLASSDSEDSESDSSDTCSSCSSKPSSDECDEKGKDDNSLDYTHTNGRSPVHLQPV